MKTKYLIVLLASLLAGCTTTPIQMASRVHANGLTPPLEVVEIGGERFSCDFYDENEQGWIKEYVPQGQTVGNWQKLVGIRYFKNLESPEKYIKEMAAQYSREYPHIQFAVFEKKETQQWVIDYIIYTKAKQGFVEWDYFQAEKANNGTGIIVNQYAIRAPFTGSSTSGFEKLNLVEQRPKLLTILMKSDFKTKTEQQP
jgi:hypothetical protein